MSNKTNIWSMRKDNKPEQKFKRSTGFEKSPDGSKLYRIALEEIRQSLSNQLDELNGVRAKGVSFIAFVAAVTGFLVSTTVKSVHPDDHFHWLAIIATCLMVWSLIQSGWLLIPARKFAFKVNPYELVDGYIEATDNPPSEAMLLRALAETYSQSILFNQVNLKKVRRAYNQLVISGLSSLFVWTFIIWQFGTVGS